MDPEALLADLDPAQRAAVTSPATPLVILAPAGSGKTRVLTRRIAWRIATGDADPRHVLALTFTRKAAGELAGRLRRLGLRDEVAAGTFHAVAYAQLRVRWSDRGWIAPTLLPARARFLTDLPELRRSGVSAPALATEIDWAKSRLIAADRYGAAVTAAGRRTPVDPEVIAALYAAYEDGKRAARLVDFDDLLRHCIDALETDEAFATAQRWRFRHLFVDEFQDVNALQFRLLEAWRGDHYDLCVVGDPQQAIYGWNGADARYLAEVQQHYPPAEIVALDRNYRSTPEILAAAATVLRAGRQDGTAVEATVAPGALPTVARHLDEREEAAAIARAVRDEHTPGSPWTAQAVLVRTHAQTRPIVDALRHAGIPCRVRGTSSFLDRPVVREAVRVLRSSPGPLASILPDLDQPSSDDEDDEVLADRDALVRLAGDYLRLDPTASAPGFAGWLTATLQREPPDGAIDAVDVATFHAAKGLEWPVVHLAGLEEGFVPISHARSTAARAEEARLLYVAMTRAERVLRCTWAAQRTFGAKVVERRASPLVRALTEQQASRAAQRPGGPIDPSWRDHLATQRSILAGVTAHPPDALVALQRWRDAAARAARIDPEALLPDRVLDSIATAAPLDLDALAAVEGVDPLLAARLGESLLAALREADAAATR